MKGRETELGKTKVSHRFTTTYDKRGERLLTMVDKKGRRGGVGAVVDTLNGLMGGFGRKRSLKQLTCMG